jgi:hypothetical protein
MNRRSFIKHGAFVGGSFLTYGNVFASSNNNPNPDDTAVLFVFLNGGATHIETFNPVPQAPIEFRSTTGAIDTNVPGLQVGGLFKNLAQRANKVVIPRAFGHKDQNHASSVHWVVTGEPNFGAGTNSKWPSHGSVMSRYHGTNAANGLPTYIKLGKFRHDAAAWLGGKYTGYDADAQGRKDLQLLSGSDRFKSRINILDVVDSNFTKTNKSHQIVQDWGDLKGQAINVVLGDASEAFKVEEDDKYKDFQASQFGKDSLTAIRLLEAGAKFVTITTGGWDMHSNIVGGLNNRQVELDTYLSKIMDTLEERGMYKRVMLVVTSEFGRTPKVNGNAGRDHFGRIAPLMISCGSYDMGRTIGTTTANADDFDQDRTTPEDLTWTIFDHLNMKKDTRYVATDGRPHDIVKKTAKNILKDFS